MCHVDGVADPLVCSVCGGKVFTETAVLWDVLVAQWQLAPAEREYTDRQQGKTCVECGSNLRSIALASAIQSALNSTLLLKELVASPAVQNLSLLEINEAGNLSSFLRGMPGHQLAAYPAIDMHALPFADESFDFVIHSDTLEHVRQPIRALSECRRVLKTGGWLCFTIPTIVGRMTRSRAGLEPSYHGNPSDTPEDYIVHTEFGADMWTTVLEAGFQNVTINAVEYPAATAMRAQR